MPSQSHSTSVSPSASHEANAILDLGYRSSEFPLFQGSFGWAWTVPKAKHSPAHFNTGGRRSQGSAPQPSHPPLLPHPTELRDPLWPPKKTLKPGLGQPPSGSEGSRSPFSITSFLTPGGAEPSQPACGVRPRRPCLLRSAD